MTKEQYIRSNKVGYPLVMVTCMITIGTLLGAIVTGMATTAAYIQAVGIIGAMLLSTFGYIKLRDCKSGMICVAGGGALMYLLICFFNNNQFVVLYGFAILFISMTYLNKRLIIWGNSIISVGFLVHTLRMLAAGTLNGEVVFVMVVAILLCGIASIAAIRLLLKFNEENMAMISEKAEAQLKAATVMQGVAEEITERFEQASESMKALNKAIEINDDAMKNISGSTESTAMAAQDQAEMCASIQAETDQVGHSIEEMMKASDVVKSNITEGASLVGQLREQADTVTRTNRTTTEAVTRLATKVEEVKNITNAILTISSQTNLLALNASIEAARAGDAGRGFAVVADEIRALSENTRESANQITSIIGELVIDVTATTESMDISTTTIEKQTDMIDTTKTSFETIEREVNDLINNIHGTEQIMQEILRATGIINENIGHLSAASEEVAATSEEGVNASKEAVEEIRKVNEELRQIMELSVKLKEL